MVGNEIFFDQIAPCYIKGIFTISKAHIKYSQARSYACQGGSMLKNLSPGPAGTISHKLLTYERIKT